MDADYQRWGYVGLAFMLVIMAVWSPFIVSMALKQTKQDLPPRDDKSKKH
jgi:hypothetical protein